MSVRQREHSVTLVLTQNTYRKAAAAAEREGKPVEEFLQRVVSDDLEERGQIRARWERLSTQYRDRLQREGKLNQSPEEVLEDLRQLREQIVDELYPR